MDAFKNSLWSKCENFDDTVITLAQQAKTGQYFKGMSSDLHPTSAAVQKKKKKKNEENFYHVPEPGETCP